MINKFKIIKKNVITFFTLVFIIALFFAVIYFKKQHRIARITKAQFNKSTIAPFINTKTSKYGYINKQGEYVIKPKFDDASVFHDGYAMAKLNNKWGVINVNGFFVVNPIYESSLNNS